MAFKTGMNSCRLPPLLEHSTRPVKRPSKKCISEGPTESDHCNDKINDARTPALLLRAAQAFPATLNTNFAICVPFVTDTNVPGDRA